MSDVELKWKPGDVVRLKTGGWPMTVQSVETYTKSDGQKLSTAVECVWFEKRPTGLARSEAGFDREFSWDGPKFGTFYEDALEKCEPLK